MAEPKLPFRREMEFTYDEADRVSPLVRRVVARNPTPFTLYGTNSYIVGEGAVAVIDPGPPLEAHVEALVRALDGETVTHILVTHTHMDHSPAAAMLKARVGGEVVGALPRPLPPGTPSESIQSDFAPDRVAADGTTIAGDGWTLRAVATPGHMSNHHCFALAEENALFSGDHVMGWNTTIVSPPDGNMREYLDSLDRCLARTDARYWPGHGPAIDAPQAYVRALLAHRRMRETEIAACLARGVTTIPAMVAVMYRHLPESMHRAAARSVLAHLEHMVATGRAACDGAPGAETEFRAP
jgi:glyoxylase-like metal-dependent hydrolase (beta-lactamase superfamily II)